MVIASRPRRAVLLLLACYSTCASPHLRGNPLAATSDRIAQASAPSLSPSPPSHPPPPPLAECFGAHGWGDHGEQFRGSVSHTRNGLSCQPWARQHPHQHHGDTKPPGVNFSLSANFCRNTVKVDGKAQPAPWCFTTDPSTRIGICDVCQASKDQQKDVPFMGLGVAFLQF